MKTTNKYGHIIKVRGYTQDGTIYIGRSDTRSHDGAFITPDQAVRVAEALLHHARRVCEASEVAL